LIASQDCKDTNPSYAPAQKSLPAIVPFANPKRKWQKQVIQFMNEVVKLDRAILNARQTTNGGDLPHRWVSVS
jgi:hypothetical protein